MEPLKRNTSRSFQIFSDHFKSIIQSLDGQISLALTSSPQDLESKNTCFQPWTLSLWDCFQVFLVVPQ